MSSPALFHFIGGEIEAQESLELCPKAQRFPSVLCVSHECKIISVTIWEGVCSGNIQPEARILFVGKGSVKFICLFVLGKVLGSQLLLTFMPAFWNAVTEGVYHHTQF